MRIWAYELIDVLPKKQLLAMRYELGDMIKQYPNIKHGLVKFANNYDIASLGKYYTEVIFEICKRGYNFNKKYDETLIELIKNKSKNLLDNKRYKEDDDRYLKQCYFNLQEKFDRKIITEEEWKLIESKFKKQIEVSKDVD